MTGQATVSTRLLAQSPTNAAVRVGPLDSQPVEAILDRVAALPFLPPAWQRRHRRWMRGAEAILGRLQTAPGQGWQERWLNRGADQGTDWMLTLAERAGSDTSAPRWRPALDYVTLRRLVAMLAGRFWATSNNIIRASTPCTCQTRSRSPGANASSTSPTSTAPGCVRAVRHLLRRACLLPRHPAVGTGGSVGGAQPGAAGRHRG